MQDAAAVLWEVPNAEDIVTPAVPSQRPTLQVTGAKQAAGEASSAALATVLSRVPRGSLVAPAVATVAAVEALLVHRAALCRASAKVSDVVRTTTNRAQALTPWLARAMQDQASRPSKAPCCRQGNLTLQTQRRWEWADSDLHPVDTTAASTRSTASHNSRRRSSRPGYPRRVRTTCTTPRLALTLTNLPLNLAAGRVFRCRSCRTIPLRSGCRPLRPRQPSIQPTRSSYPRPDPTMLLPSSARIPPHLRARTSS